MANLESGFFFGVVLGCLIYVPVFVWHMHHMHDELRKDMKEKR